MKKFNNVVFRIVAVFALVPFLSSCNDDDGSEAPQGLSLGDGYFIVNEGNFGNSNTTLSFFDRSSEEVTNDVYQTANGVALGDQSQSMAIFNGKGYAVVQNSGKVEVLDISNGESEVIISDDISSPRYFLGIDDTKGYVSDWGESGNVKVIDLTTNTVSKTIAVGAGPNKMLLKDGFAYVANSGGFGQDSTVYVINVTTDEVTDTIQVGYNPETVVEDADGNMWVLCKGYGVYDWDTFELLDSRNGSIVKLNSSHEVILDIPMSGFSANNMVIDNKGENFFYVDNSAVYKMSTSATFLPTAEFISKDYYGLGVDPQTNGVLGADAGDYTASGTVDVYDSTGTLTDSYTAGIIPSGFAFK